MTLEQDLARIKEDLIKIKDDQFTGTRRYGLYLMTLFTMLGTYHLLDIEASKLNPDLPSEMSRRDFDDNGYDDLRITLDGKTITLYQDSTGNFSTEKQNYK